MATKIKYAPYVNTAKSRALAWVGRYYRPGWCAYFQIIEIYGVLGVGDFDHNGRANAVDYWKAAVAHGKVIKTNDPKKLVPGSMALWTGGSLGDGHAAFVISPTEIVSTDLPRRGYVGRVASTMPSRQWGLRLVGCVLVDGNGFQLVPKLPGPHAPVPPAPAKVIGEYKVTAKRGLYGRTGPSKAAKIKGNGDAPGELLVRPHGYVIKAVKIAKGKDGREWAVTSKETFYALDYLEKVA